MVNRMMKIVRLVSDVSFIKQPQQTEQTKNIKKKSGKQQTENNGEGNFLPPLVLIGLVNISIELVSFVLFINDLFGFKKI